MIELARELDEMGFKHSRDSRHSKDGSRAPGLPCEFVYKVNEGRPNVADLVKSRQIDLIINTPLGRTSFYDERSIRRAAIQYSVPCVTTMTGAIATVAAIRRFERRRAPGSQPSGIPRSEQDLGGRI